MESNINVRKKFDAEVDAVMNATHMIMPVGTSVSNNSFEINCEMVQERWGINPSMSKNMVERTTQCGVRISCPHPSLMKCMRTNDRMLQYKWSPCNVFADTLISGTA